MTHSPRQTTCISHSSNQHLKYAVPAALSPSCKTCPASAMVAAPRRHQNIVFQELGPSMHASTEREHSPRPSLTNTSAWHASRKIHKHELTGPRTCKRLGCSVSGAWCNNTTRATMRRSLRCAVSLQQGIERARDPVFATREEVSRAVPARYSCR